MQMTAAYRRMNVDTELGEAEVRRLVPELRFAQPVPPAPSRFGGERRISWSGLIAVILIHAVLIGALVTYKFAAGDKPRRAPTVVTLVPDMAPPPPAEALPPEPVEVAAQQPEIVAPEPMVQTPTAPSIAVADQPSPPQPVAVQATPSAAPAAAAAIAAPATASPPAAITPPSYNAKHLNNPAPRRSAASIRAGEAGKVVLRVMVTPQGRPAEIKVTQSSGFDRLDDAALAAVRKWRFVPAEQAGQPVASWVTFPITFTIKS